MIYKDRVVLLASKHKKEQVIAPVFRDTLACDVCIEDIDTDQFGTFTGEIQRSLSAHETCILKAKYAANEKKYDLSLASEGSFGPHPSNPFIGSAHEIMAFVDLANDWVITEQLLTSKTNYKMMIIRQDSDLELFLKTVHFPSHALTLQSGDRRDVIAKGITDYDSLQIFLLKGFKKYSELFIATDMRAMMNPTRMQTLAELAEKLACRIQSACPGCGVPGFGFKSVSGYLPCSLCKSETQRYKFEEFGCIRCEYKETKLRKDGITMADPSHCDYCNP